MNQPMRSFTEGAKIYREQVTCQPFFLVNDFIRLLPGSECATPLGIAEFAVVSDLKSSWYIKATIYGHVVNID
jgi:hypothetical protein